MRRRSGGRSTRPRSRARRPRSPAAPCASRSAFERGPCRRGRPAKCTGMIAFVRARDRGLDLVEVDQARLAARCRRTPASRRRARSRWPRRRTSSPGTITSSPGPTPERLMPRMSAAVQEDTQRTCAAPRYSSSIRSKRRTFGPVPIQPDRSESTTSSISASSITGLPKTRNGSAHRRATLACSGSISRFARPGGPAHRTRLGRRRAWRRKRGTPTSGSGRCVLDGRPRSERGPSGWSARPTSPRTRTNRPHSLPPRGWLPPPRSACAPARPRELAGRVELPPQRDQRGPQVEL